MLAVIDRIRPKTMPRAHGIGANRQILLSENMPRGTANIFSSVQIRSLVRSYFEVHGVKQPDTNTFAEIFRQYEETGDGHYVKGILDNNFIPQVRIQCYQEFKERGEFWDMQSEKGIRRSWPLLYSIKMALTPFLKGPVDGMYILEERPGYWSFEFWDPTVKSANDNPSAIDPSVFYDDISYGMVA